MKDRRVKDVAASVRQRLLNAARESGRPFQEVLQYFAMERFLYRLGQTEHADKFVLKGALMLSVWGAAATRPTRDIDFLGRMQNDAEEVARAIRDVCRQPVESDGLVFDPDSIEARAIKQDADYEGVRVTFRGHLQNARIPMQVDVAFGDVLYPIPPVTDYPTILDYAAPSLRVYSRESTIAEKFEAMVKLGQLNSRMKDFHDIWLLSRHFEFDGATLATAIERTFAHRGTTIASNPTAFSAAFTTDPAKVRQWQGFLRKSKLEGVPDELAIIVREIASFLGPTAEALSDKRSFSLTWQPPGPWSRS
jgi:predicted nucleotidyltransferase component of viral defense system